MNLENIEIKKLEKQGLDTLMGWASNEGWNPGKNDAKVFWDTVQMAFTVVLLKII